MNFILLWEHGSDPWLCHLSNELAFPREGKHFNWWLQCQRLPLPSHILVTPISGDLKNHPDRELLPGLGLSFAQLQAQSWALGFGWEGQVGGLCSIRTRAENLISKYS